MPATSISRTKHLSVISRFAASRINIASTRNKTVGDPTISERLGDLKVSCSRRCAAMRRAVAPAGASRGADPRIWLDRHGKTAGTSGSRVAKLRRPLLQEGLNAFTGVGHLSHLLHAARVDAVRFHGMGRALHLPHHLARHGDRNRRGAAGDFGGDFAPAAKPSVQHLAEKPPAVASSAEKIRPERVHCASRICRRGAAEPG